MPSHVSPWVGFTNFVDAGGGDGGPVANWGSPTYAATQDGSYAYAEGAASPYAGYSNWLHATGLTSVPMPIGVQILGIEIGLFALTVSSAGPGVADTMVVKGGSRVGSIITTPSIGGSFANYYTGGDGTLFGTNVRREELKSSGFGIAVRARRTASQYVELHVDYLKVRFYYRYSGIIAIM